MAELLKDLYFTRRSLSELCSSFQKVYPEFDKKMFDQLVYGDDWDKRELKSRMRRVTESLSHLLPKEYKKAISILKKVAPEVKGFEGMVFPDYVELYGLDDWDTSLEALIYFTRYSSSEFAVRPFLNKDPERVMGYMVKNARNRNEHIRRFASEGCRPRLPWAMALPKFKKDPGLILPVLECLKDDKSEYVRKSVANNLNDISKDNPETALAIFKKWLGNSGRTDWIVKHAARTLLKAGNKDAMELFGYCSTDMVKIKSLEFASDNLSLGDNLLFSFEMEVLSNQKSNIRLEYQIEFIKSGGKTGKKVFKITENHYQPGSYCFEKKHQFRQMTTRKHYSGEHRFTLIVNGDRLKNKKFFLTV